MKFTVLFLIMVFIQINIAFSAGAISNINYNKPFGQVNHIDNDRIQIGSVNIIQLLVVLNTNNNNMSMFDRNFYLIKPGFDTVVCKLEKYIGYDKIYLKILEGNTNGLLLGEKVFLSITSIEENKKNFEKIASQPGDNPAVGSYEEITNAVEKLVNGKKYTDAIGELIAFINREKNKSAESSRLAAAYFKIAMIFKHESNPQYLGLDLDDEINQREILLKIVKEYPGEKKWVERAYYNLAYYYLNTFWETKNELFYQYILLAGNYGKVLFDYGENLLKNAEKNSTIFLNGSDSDVFSIQCLLQNKKIREDISVYDLNGIIFDRFNSSGENNSYYNDFIEGVQYLIENKRPPQYTKIRTFLDEKTAFRKKNGPFYFSGYPDYITNINSSRSNNGQKPFGLNQLGYLYELTEKNESPKSAANKNDIWKNYQWAGNKEEWIDYPFAARGLLAFYFFQYGAYNLTNKQTMQAKSNIDTAVNIGNDNYWILRSAAAEYANNLDKDYRTGKIKNVLTHALDNYKNDWNLYKLMFFHLIREILINPAAQETNMALADKYIDDLKQVSSNHDETKAMKTSFKTYFDDIDSIKNEPIAGFNNHLEVAENDIKNNLVEGDDREMLRKMNRWAAFYDVNYYRKELDKILPLFLKTTTSYYGIYYDAFYISFNSGRTNIAFQLGEYIEKLNPDIKSSADFDYAMGKLYYGSKIYGKARTWLNNFNDLIKDDQRNSNKYYNEIKTVDKIMKEMPEQD